MHMADALVSPAVAVTMYAASAAAAGVSLVQLHKEEAAAPELAKKKLPTMAVMSALVFAGQMINYTIPGTGSSGHLCGGMLLSAILGPWAGFLSMIVILAIQALFFADGGLLALGANVWNMAFYACVVGYFLIYRPLMQGRLLSGKGRTKLVLASVLGCVVTLQLGAFSVVVETSLSGITALPLGAFAALMQPIHLAIGLVEGLITAAVLLFVYQTRPELLQGAAGTGAKNRCSRKAALAILAAAALVIGGGLSLLASSSPDGLEWSLFPVAGYQLAGLPMRLCFQKLRMVLPLVCAVGLLNPLFDRQIVVQVGTLAVSGGVLSMLTLILKGVFCLLASFLLMATTTIEAICRALRQLHVPKLLTNLLLLTFRYVGLLLSEVAVMQQAYSLRAPGQKGIHISAWGSFLGQLLLRSMDRAQALYESMELRGFSGEFPGAVRGRGSAASWPYALVCPALMLLARYFDLSALMGGLFV